MGIYLTQRDATRNQSTVDYLSQNIFQFGNRYQSGIFINNLGETLQAQDGILVVRNSGTGASANVTVVNGTAGVDEGFSPATSATMANVIGILKIEGINEMANAASLPANYCISGDIDASMLILPEGLTLDSVVGSKSVKDILTALGFVLNNTIELSKFNN